MKKGYFGLYEANCRGPERWLDFVTDPNRARSLNRQFGRFDLADNIGLISYRLLDMSFRTNRKTFEKSGTGRRALRKQLKKRRIYSDYVRTENLAGDLFALLMRRSAHLKLKHPLTTPEEMIARVPQRNASRKIEGVSTKNISPELRQRVIDREWLIYKEFGYTDNPMGLPSDQNPRFNVNN